VRVVMIIPSTSAHPPFVHIERRALIKFANRQADLFSIASAADIHGSKFDSPANSIVPQGVLDHSITPAKYVSFINYADSS